MPLTQVTSLEEAECLQEGVGWLSCQARTQRGSFKGAPLRLGNLPTPTPTPTPSDKHLRGSLLPSLGNT